MGVAPSAPAWRDGEAEEPARTAGSPLVGHGWRGLLGTGNRQGFPALDTAQTLTYAHHGSGPEVIGSPVARRATFSGALRLLVHGATPCDAAALLPERTAVRTPDGDRESIGGSEPKEDLTMVASRARVEHALQHKAPDMVPLDLGGSAVTGMHVDSVYKLRQALRLDPAGTPVKVVEPFQLLGEIAPDLLDALGVDVVGLGLPATMLGFRNEGWKPWTTFGGTPVLVPEGFNTVPEANGDLFAYPAGDTSVPPCARMPKGGFYFDALTRQDPIDDDRLNVEDNLEEFTPISDADLAHLGHELDRLWPTGRAILGNFGGTAFGDIALVPGMNLKHPKGIRAVDEWYMSTAQRQDYVREIFDRQCDIGLRNLEKIHQVVGDRVTAVFVTGTDFGAQNGPFISPKAYRSLFKPFHVKVNEWIHMHTSWGSFIHSCGSIWRLMDDLVDAGFDCFNPVQTSATDMDPVALKARYGDRITFWGGGIDTQRVLPFGTPDDVRAMVKDRMRVLGAGGGFVFTPIHNVQAGIPVENLLALYDSVKEYRAYPE